MVKLSDWIKRGGQPDKLSAASERLSAEVQAKVSAQAPVFRTDAQQSNSLLADDRWRGDAAMAYRQVLNPQSIALGGYADTTAAVSAALNECGWAIMLFWGGVAGGLIVLVGGVIAAIALSATVLGAIAAILGALCAAAATFVTCLLVAQNTMSSQASVFRTQANDNKLFGEGGNWPRAGRSLETGAARP